MQLLLSTRIGRDVIESTTTWSVGRGIHSGSAELKGGATVYLYGMKAFALAIAVCCTAS